MALKICFLSEFLVPFYVLEMLIYDAAKISLLVRRKGVINISADS